MHIGFVGLGKMGSQMTTRILEAGHKVSVKDPNDSAVEAMVEKGAIAVSDYQAMIDGFGGEQVVIWLMIPQQFVAQEVAAILEVAPANSIIIDGGNSDYRNTLDHAALVEAKQCYLIDVGTSGGVHGLEQGFSMMAGGDEQAFVVIEPIMEALAQKDGYGRFGKTGAGHFIKMVHNGIEYGIMQAFAEGYRLIMEGPFESVDVAGIAKVWQHGSINESFLNGLIQNMLERDPMFGQVGGEVAESGEARWTLETAKELGIDTPVIQAAFDVRLASQKGDINYATKFLAQLRNEFGGHAVNVDAS